MPQERANTVIHRKAQVAREEFDARAMTPAKALRLALARAADKAFDLPLVVSLVEQGKLRPSQITELIPEERLFLLFDGPEGARGAVAADLGFVSAVIEQQTMGKVSDREIGERPMTRTDAALVHPLLDAGFEEFERQLLDYDRAEAWQGFRYGAMVEDRRALNLALSSDSYQHFQISVALGASQRQGRLDILLDVREPAPATAEEQSFGTGAAEKLGAVAMQAPVTLSAVLERVKLPLERALTLKEGECLPLLEGARLRVQLETSCGHVMSEARLGQVSGMRAVRLLGGPVVTPQAGSGSTDQTKASAPRPVVKPVAQVEAIAAPTTDVGSVVQTPGGPEHPAGSGDVVAIDPPQDGPHPGLEGADGAGTTMSAPGPSPEADATVGSSEMAMT